jgi:hypothetical protein
MYRIELTSDNEFMIQIIIYKVKCECSSTTDSVNDSKSLIH